MHERFQDAMAYVRKFGSPDLFITFTCNPKWDEITRCLKPGQQAIHNHIITGRVFKQKLVKLMAMVKK